MTTKSRSLPPNLLVASRIQRLLSPLPLEAKSRVLGFLLSEVQEEIHAQYKAEMNAVPLPPGMNFGVSGAGGNGQAKLPE